MFNVLNMNILLELKFCGMSSLCASDWFLCSRCSDRSEAGGGWSSQGTAGIVGSAHGASADPSTSGYQ